MGKKLIATVLFISLLAMSGCSSTSERESHVTVESSASNPQSISSQIEVEESTSEESSIEPVELSVPQQFCDISFYIPDTWAISVNGDSSDSAGYFLRTQSNSIVTFAISENIDFDTYVDNYEMDFESLNGVSNIQGKEVELMGKPVLYVTCQLPMENRSGETETYFTFWNIFESSDGIAMAILGIPESEENSLDEYLQEYEEVVQSIELVQIASTDEPVISSPSSEPEDSSDSSAVDTHTSEQAAALSKAFDYLDFTSFSYSGLVDQLEYEGFSTEDATWAADNCGADWNEQALQSAKDYLDYTAFSYSGLIGQLEYEGFTTEQATYGVDNCGADWMEQAALCAQNYLDYTEFSRQGLIDQLLYEGFTQEQAEYGVTQAGM